MIKNLQSLHDYVKENYKAGNYEASAEEYKQWNNDYQATIKGKNLADKTDDFQMGYQQALTDFDNGRAFHDYPEAMINFGNIISGDRMREIADFIKGYNSAKHETADKAK